ncbi:hypothetical protein [Aequorivita sp. CIP111184]|uniref:hypothetical protein n=1 Tax=Aequorivita sp. CIP111184 TaxID=2211356 RepID=UPI000DBBFD87|nr:hypothetical protein [Aequorivita sp. CIP111184]SRX54475.1 hypothetical protein AEQU1_01485 [Aequorivita sp. CIP111184]
MEQSTMPNQEIVVQFNASSISTDEAEQAISNITSQLKAVGIEVFQVSEIRGGKLKVTYYSKVDVAIIKDLFDNQNKLGLGYSTFDEQRDSSKIPFGDEHNTYRLAVSKIQKDSGSDLGLHGLPVEVKSAKDQYLNPIVSLGTSETNFCFKHSIERVLYKNYRDASLLFDNTTHKIPEVRAGPLS